VRPPLCDGLLDVANAYRASTPPLVMRERILRSRSCDVAAYLAIYRLAQDQHLLQRQLTTNARIPRTLLTTHSTQVSTLHSARTHKQPQSSEAQTAHPPPSCNARLQPLSPATRYTTERLIHYGDLTDALQHKA